MGQALQPYTLKNGLTQVSVLSFGQSQGSQQVEEQLYKKQLRLVGVKGKAVAFISLV